MTTKKAYAIVRETEGTAWIDISTISVLQSQALNKALDMDKRVPSYARENPIKHVSQIEITELYRTTLNNSKPWL